MKNRKKNSFQYVLKLLYLFQVYIIYPGWYVLVYNLTSSSHGNAYLLEIFILLILINIPVSILEVGIDILDFIVFNQYNVLILWINTSVCLAAGLSDFELSGLERTGSLLDFMNTSSSLEFHPELSICCWLSIEITITSDI